MPKPHKKVLLIDSEPTLTLALSDALVDADLSLSPLLARTAEDALAILRSDSGIELIVLDLSLPGTDGHALAKTILADFPHAGVILTGTLICSDLRAEFEGQALGCLEKPFDLEEFMQLSYKGLQCGG